MALKTKHFEDRSYFKEYTPTMVLFIIVFGSNILFFESLNPSHSC